MQIVTLLKLAQKLFFHMTPISICTGVIGVWLLCLNGPVWGNYSGEWPIDHYAAGPSAVTQRPKVNQSFNRRNYIRDKKLEGKIRTMRGVVDTSYGKIAYEIHADAYRWEFALRAKEVLEQDARKLADYFQYAPPGPINIMAMGASNPNGAATIFPSNLIWLNDYPPRVDGVLYANKEWIRPLIVHELAHLFHMDQTRGILNVLSTLFGSIGKMGGVTPRWFSEGVAVWAESHFTQYGRLSHRGERQDFANVVLEGKTCLKIDCLDEPATFPFLRNPYRVGGYFMEFIEKRRPGTISCLIRANSDSIPFFLNSAFKECTGMKAQQHFKQFIRQTRRQAQAQKSKSSPSKWARSGQLLKLAPGEVIDWSKGIGTKGDYLIYHSFRNKIPYLVATNIKTGQRRERQFAAPIKTIRSANRLKEAVTLQLALPIKGGGKLAAIQYSPQKDAVIEEIEQGGHFDYLFKTDGPIRQYWALKYQNSRWSLYKVNFSKKIDFKKLNPMYQFPVLMNIFDPVIINKGQRPHLGFITNFSQEVGRITARQRHFYYLLSLSNRPETFKVFDWENAFSFNGQCGKKLLFQSDRGGKAQFLGVNLAKNLRSNFPKVELISGGSVSNIIELKLGDNFSVAKGPAGNSRPTIVPGSCEKVMGKMRQGAQVSQKIIKKRPNQFGKLAKNTDELKLKEIAFLRDSFTKDSSFYPGLRHFRPHYWFLFYNSGKSLSSISASTSISDPKGFHKLDFSGRYYTKISKFAPFASFRTKLGRTGLGAGVRYSKFFSRTSFSTKNDTFEETQGFIDWPLAKNKWSFTPSLYAADGRALDFLSNRKYQRAGMQNSLIYFPAFRNSFFQTSSLVANTYFQDTQEKEDFWGLDTKLIIKNSWSSRIKTKLQGSYGRLFKTNTGSGVLFGGGATSDLLGANIFHEFYALPYSDIYGNRIATGRGEVSFLVKEIRRGPGLFPLYFKDFNVFAGGEYLDAQNVFVDKILQRNKHLVAAHAGVRFDMTLAYLAAVEIDLIFNKIVSSDIDEDKDGAVTSLFLLKGSLF